MRNLGFQTPSGHNRRTISSYTLALLLLLLLFHTFSGLPGGVDNCSPTRSPEALKDSSEAATRIRPPESS